jgi:N-acetylmuramoyl-L-alanine amidase
MRHIGQSLEAARLIESTLQGRIPMAATPIDRAPFRVLESANMPALVIEVGYLTNPEQEKLLTRAEFQTTFAEAVVEALVRFRDYLAAENDR